MPLGGAGSGSGVASLAGSAGNVSLLLFQAPSPGGQVTPAEARPPLSGCPVLVLGSDTDDVVVDDPLAMG